MIIDSHAHYNNSAYKKPFRYLSCDKDGYALKEGGRDQLFQEMLAANIPYSIEPGVGLESCKDVIQPKLLRRARNTSLILPAVIKKIAELKDISADKVEQATTENTIRLFQLPITVEEQSP